MPPFRPTPAVPSPAVESIEITVPAEEVELASGTMWGAGVAGIEERADADGRVRLIAGVESERVAAVEAALASRWAVTRGEMHPEEWADAWRPFARAVRLSGDIVVQPPWIDPIAGPGDTVISLDPQQAWGHGAHPSTVGTAEAMLASGRLAGGSVLDVGCGSGLLAILAAIRGARRVVAVDVDPAAVEATLANALVNGVDALIEVSSTPVGVLGGRFDVVAANIGLGVLAELSTVLSALVADDGLLLLSGLLDDQADAAAAAYPGMVELSRSSSEGWSVVVLTPSTAPRSAAPPSASSAASTSERGTPSTNRIASR